MKFRIAIPILAFVAATMSAVSASAHDLVLIPDGPKTLTMKFGHPPDYEAPDPEKIFLLDAYATNDNTSISLLSAVTKGNGEHSTLNMAGLTGERSIAIVAGEYDNGYFASVTKNKYFNTSKLNLPKATDSGYFLKFAKSLYPLAAKGGFDRVLGQQLELIPQSDPFAVRPGQKLPVRVLFRSQPLAGVGLECGDGVTKIKEVDIPRYKTNTEGIALIPIEKVGLQIIALDYQTPPRFPALSDHDDYGASLTFIVSAKVE